MHVVWYIMICMIVWLYIYSWKKVGTGGRQFKFLFLDLRYLNVSMSNIAQARVRDPNHPANQIVPAASERRVAGSVPCVVFVADIVLPGMTIQTKYIIHVYIYIHMHVFMFAYIHPCIQLVHFSEAINQISPWNTAAFADLKTKKMWEQLLPCRWGASKVTLRKL